MTKILFLDDSPERHAVMKEAYPDYLPAYNLAQFCAILEGPEEVSEVWLDHDLGAHDGGVSDTPFSGLTAALILTTQKRRMPVRVHSWNPVGAERMVEVLEEACFDVHYDPFSHSSDGFPGDENDRSWRLYMFDQARDLESECPKAAVRRAAAQE